MDKITKKLVNGQQHGKAKSQIMLEDFTLMMEKSKDNGKKQLRIIVSQIYEIGEYFNNKRQGYWKYYYENQEIGGGQYNQQGERNGKWIEASDGFGQFSQIVYIGEYKNGKKISIWDILYRIYGKEHFKSIGFGSYDEGGNGNKIGKWIESSDEFKWGQEVTYHGLYKNGKKVGRWDILAVDHTMKEVMALKLESGLSQMMGLGRDPKLFIMVYIKMVRKLVGGIFIIIRRMKIININ
ncbi:unnamed protein product [Paramecium primaurelia]|uniref:MORN repeat protein n=1 Tax=Paramecium primaurelia TaxID=5886 RepID=A0A8S1N0D1_PARPR|nr:unnamed protein product [Paramecium primaurelia]